jgi:hypothetical protein
MNNFKIHFRKQHGECQNVEVCINTGANTETPWYILKIDLGSTIAAEFVAEELNKRLQNLMEEVRRNAYERGWKDAKRKRRKTECFPSMCYRTWFEEGK